MRVLALDVGTSSVRAPVFGPDAAEGVAARRNYTGETDPDRIVELARATLAEALGDEQVDAAGASCFGHSLLALDAHGRPLTPILGWRDRRSADAAERLARRLDGEAVHARTGCHLHWSYWPAKLAWLTEEEPDVVRSAHRFVSFAEYLYGRVLGVEDVPVSLSLACGTGLIDLATRMWDEELLAAIGVDERRLPRISDDPVGTWYPALLDGACANIGTGCVSRGRAVLMIGTSGAFRTLYEVETLRPRPGLFLYRVDEGRVLEGGALSDGGNVYSWLHHTLRDADGSLAGRDPDSHGLTFLTLLGGERSPGWSLHATGAVQGLTFETTPLDLQQAALEGVAFRFAEVAALMPEVEEVVTAGGALLKDPDWLQIMADVLERPLVTSSVKEASLRGAAVTTLERLGVSAPQPPVGRRVEPRADRVPAYRAARERQRRLYRVATAADTS
jgi:gluconokinase